MDTCCHIYTWVLLSFFLFIVEHFWQMMIWEIDWPQCSRRNIFERYTCKLLWEQYINTSVSNSIKHMPQSSLRCLWQIRMWLCLSRLRFFGWLYNPNISLPVLMPFWNAKYCYDTFLEMLNIVLMLLLMVIYLLSPIYMFVHVESDLLPIFAGLLQAAMYTWWLLISDVTFVIYEHLWYMNLLWYMIVDLNYMSPFIYSK